MPITLNARTFTNGKKGGISFPPTLLSNAANTVQVSGFNALVKQFIITNTSASPVTVTIASSTGVVLFNESIAAAPTNATQFITFEADGLFLPGGFQAWADTNNVVTLSAVFYDNAIFAGANV